MATLDLYRAKRDFTRTSEPAGRSRAKRARAGGAFVIHKHAARQLHYDLRLEHGGALWSWAVTKGPSLDPADKRLAVHVEDHPLDYAPFEGMIPKGQYGGGAVIVWDEGQWIPEADPAEGMAKGHLKFELRGHKLNGAWNLVRLAPRRGEKRDNWLLIKSNDDFADPDRNILEAEPRSVKSGRTIEDVEAGKPPRRKTKGSKTDGAKTNGAKTNGAKTNGGKTNDAEKKGVVRTSAKASAKAQDVADMPTAATTKKAVKIKAKTSAGKGVTLSNADKVLWPDAGLTKRGLLEYYERVWPRMRDYVIDRPLSLLRAPDGVGKQTFFQKHASAGMPAAIKVTKDPQDGEELLTISDFDGLASLVQLGVVEIHVWGCAIDALETPDQMIFDLDPDEGLDVKRVREGALLLRDRLRDLGFTTFLKTSGGKGYHVVAPLKPKADWETVRTFAHDFARAIEQEHPKAYTATLSKKARAGRVFIDYLRNGRGSTAVAAYSVRAKPKATISMPIAWSELEKGVGPDAFTTNDAKRAAAGRAPWANFAKSAKALELTSGK